jgi:predicted DCC family thiol-disulfide oxidoreductase YuxK
VAEAAASGVRALPARLVLFDGVCGFCDRAVRWLMARDPAGRLGFAPLQGETAARLRQLNPEIPTEVETLVLVATADGSPRVSLRSDAAWRVCAELERPWRWLAWLRWLPRGLRDRLYVEFARRRYRWFGRLESCRVPDAAERHRFWP